MEFRQFIKQQYNNCNVKEYTSGLLSQIQRQRQIIVLVEEIQIMTSVYTCSVHCVVLRRGTLNPRDKAREARFCKGI